MEERCYLSILNIIWFTRSRMNETADCELHFVFLYLTFCEWKRSTVHKDAVFRNISTLTIAMNHINKLLFIYVLRDKCGTLQGFDIQLLAVFFFKSGFFWNSPNFMKISRNIWPRFIKCGSLFWPIAWIVYLFFFWRTNGMKLLYFELSMLWKYMKFRLSWRYFLNFFQNQL